jgi:hypothetical protein
VTFLRAGSLTRLEPETRPQSSNRSPPHAGNGISDRRDRGENAVYLQAETTYRDSSGFKKPLFWRENATRANKVRALETAWWAHQGSNLGPDD